MAFFFSFLIALVVAIAFFAIFYFLIAKAATAKRRVGWLFLAFIFFAMFLPIWAGGLWVRPFGPRIGGVSILPYILVGLAVSLILAAMMPRPAPEPDVQEQPHDEERLPREYVMEGEQYEWWSGMAWFFGIFFAFMIAAIIAGAIAR
jgi:hypothetical protein